jgi:hypothetical protein
MIICIAYLLSGFGFAQVRKVDGDSLKWYSKICMILFFPVAIGTAIGKFLNYNDRYGK